MTILNFTLNPEALSKLHDALVCLGKFDDSVSMEAYHDKLVLNTLNSTKSAYASFTLSGSKFFSKYQYGRTRSGIPNERFVFKIYNRALLSVFKGRVVDPGRDKDTAVEKCEASVEDGEGKSKSRFVVKIICKHGVLKTYRLTFESVAPIHALFIKESAHNYWSISSKTLREFVEHFGPGTEQLDFCLEDGRVTLTSFTEKIMAGNEILKQPLHTKIAVDILEFGDFKAEEKLHVVISVKDFKAIVTHSGIANTMVTARYSHPTNPMLLSYSEEGLFSEFILMTIGDARGAFTTPTLNQNLIGSIRPEPRKNLKNRSSSNRPAMEMPLPQTDAGLSFNLGRMTRPSPPRPQPSIQSDTLFLPQTDDDRRWDPVGIAEEYEDVLSWDNEKPNSATLNSRQQLRCTERRSPKCNIITGKAVQSDSNANVILPTQQSEIHGIFD